MLSNSHMFAAINQAKKGVVLPPKFTIEILESYLKSQEFWFHLKKMFKNYFHGWKPLKDIPDFEQNHEVLLQTFSEYLALYNLFSFGWSEIEKGLCKFDFNIKSPGEALIYILSEDAKNWIETPKAKPETLYRAWNAITAKDAKKIQMYYQRLVKQVGDDNLPEHYKFVEICLQLSLNSKNKTVQNVAKEYQKTVLEHLYTINKLLRKLF